MRGEEADQVGDLPTSTSGASKLNRQKSRPKFLSRVSLVNALKAYTSNEALNFPTFDVLKETTKLGFRKRQKRTFEVDIRSRNIRNLSRAGSVHKKYCVGDIERVERVPGQSDAIDLKFRTANHAYRLIFAKKHNTSAVVMRERFYQLLCLLQCKEAAEAKDEELGKEANEIEKGMRAGSDAGAGAECRVRVDLAGKPQRSLAEALDVGQESVRVVLGTFNLGGKQPPSRQELEHWMPVSSNCDVYVVGVQECNYKPQVRQQQEGPAASKAVAGHGKGDSCDQDWLCTLQEHFRPGGHVLLGSHSIQHTAAIKLTVFVHQRHAFKVKNVCWDAYACGVGGVYGNKGAVGCRLYLNETPLVFVNVHLAAHEGAAHDRNVNTANIFQKLSLGGNQSLDVLPQTSYLFYLGDLNYRVNIEYQEAVRLVKEKNQRELVLKDELQGERQKNRTLSEMKECPIEFPPTYRYNVPREKCELSFSNKKNQTPSYTDRILYHACEDAEILPLEYCSCAEVTTSDHIPVRATFDLFTNLPFSMNPGSYLGQNKRRIKFKFISARNIRLASPLLKGGNPNASGSQVKGSVGSRENVVQNPSSATASASPGGGHAGGVGLGNSLKQKARVLTGTMVLDPLKEDEEDLGSGGRRWEATKTNQKCVNLSIKFFWPFGFDGKCKTEVVEASAMEGDSSRGDYAGLSHSINADWSEDEICLLFPRVMCTEQLGSHPLAFQLIETRPLGANAKHTHHVIGSGKISLVRAAQMMANSDDSEILVNTNVVKHGIKRGDLACSLTADLEYF